MASSRRTAIIAATISRTVTAGKSKKYGRPVTGSTDAGPEEPYGEASILTQTM